MKKRLLICLISLTISAAHAQLPSTPAPLTLGPDSLQHPGVPTGTLSPKLTLTSKIYDGMVSDYWIYVPAQYDAKTAAALMVFQDGEGYLNRSGDHPALNVLDNLIAQKKIPAMIAVFTNPGDLSGSPGTPTYAFVDAYGKEWSRTLKDSMRSTEYDTVSNRYARFLRDELLPVIYAKYNIRRDAYSRAITGMSSGGICSFNVAWQQPEQFSRVITWIGTFTSIQWHEDPAVPDGGQDYPEKVLREPHRNLRVWVQDGNKRPGERALRLLAAGQYPHGECAQAEGLRFPFLIWSWARTARRKAALNSRKR